MSVLQKSARRATWCMFLALWDVLIATHFRGAHFWWKPVPGGAPSEVNINFRVAWRRNYSSLTYCDDARIASGELMGPATAGYLKCADGCEGALGDVHVRCTDYSQVEDWSVGLRNYNYNFTGENYFELRWNGRGWLKGVVHGHDVEWNMRMTIDLKRRLDTGQINRSPYAVVSPVVRMQYGCNNTLYIPVVDEDGDKIRCRWANAKKGECGGICNAFEGAFLNSEDCSLQYHADGAVGYYAVALQLEDFPDSFTSRPLCSVPLQFLVQVYKSQGPCDAKPHFIYPTAQEGECIALNVDKTHNLVLAVRTKDHFTYVTEIVTVSSIGMVKSRVKPFQTDPRDYYVDITWIPRQEQTGENIFCFSAVDNLGISSEQRCIHLVIGKKTPVAQNVSFNSMNRQLRIDFNHQVKRSPQPHYIYVMDCDDREILRQDVSDKTYVSFHNSSVSIAISQDIPCGTYSVLMETELSGAVKRNAKCGADSKQILDRSALTFTLDHDTSFCRADVTSSCWVEPMTSTRHYSTRQTTTSLGDITRRTDVPHHSSEENGLDYTWLIIIIVGIVFFISFIVIIAVICKKSRDKRTTAAKSSTSQELFIDGWQNVSPYSGPYDLKPNYEFKPRL